MIVKIGEAEYCGYELLSYIHKSFDPFLSPATVYSVLYSMERKGYIKARGDARKRVYSITPKGKRVIQTINSLGGSFCDFFLGVLRNKIGKI